jgi:hypothetical protein
MIRGTFYRLAVPALCAAVISFNGCNSEKTKEKQIIGEWNAHWQTKPDESFSELKIENLQMEGVMKFNADGKVEISAFGYEGCIFSDDTLRNVLNWKMDETVIRFIDQGDDLGLPYTINKFTTDELHLTLLEDINLTLRRN